VYIPGIPLERVAKMTFQHANKPPDQNPLPSPPPTEFVLNASPGTDIWRKPPNTNSFNAPIFYRNIKLSSFHRARVTISADWKTLYDQGGLCLVLPQSQAQSSIPHKWIKTGIEFTHGSPHVSTVACDLWADWGLLPAAGGKVTVEMERHVVDGKPTSSLWVYAVGESTRTPMREISWVFDDGADGECWIGVYAAKPNKDDDDHGDHALQVSFSDLLIETD